VAVRSGLVARQTGQRVVGVVENMAAMTLPDGTTLDLFGAGGGAGRRALCRRHGPVPLLASIPLSPSLRADADAGIPSSSPTRTTPPPSRSARWPPRSPQPRGLAGRSLPLRRLRRRLRSLRCRTAAALRVNGSRRRRRGDRARAAPRWARRRHGRVVQQRLADDARGSYWRGSSVRQSTSSKSRPSRPSRASSRSDVLPRRAW
jgi:hypothetical protein